MKKEKRKEKKYYILKIILFISLFSFFFFLSSFVISAEETSDETAEPVNADVSDMRISHSLWLQASSKVEAKQGYTFNYKLPFLQGKNVLTQDNNIDFALSAEVTPISLVGAASATITPIAFLEYSVGGRIGTGWTINLFNTKIHGLSITKTDTGNNVIFADSGGLYSKIHASGALQFDLAALYPGDWNHFVFRTYHEFFYSAHSKARNADTWIFEDQSKEYINGFNYYSSYVFGYQMPLFLSMVGSMAEMERSFYDVEDRKIQGEYLLFWTISPVVAFFNINKHMEIMTAVQYRTEKNFLEEILEGMYPRTLTVDRSSLKFYRVAVIATYKF